MSTLVITLDDTHYFLNRQYFKNNVKYLISMRSAISYFCKHILHRTGLNSWLFLCHPVFDKLQLCTVFKLQRVC